MALEGNVALLRRSGIFERNLAIGTETNQQILASHWAPADEQTPARITYEKRTSRVTVVIATLNEEVSIGHVAAHCRPYADELLVVDGHSRDLTRQIAEQEGARVVLDGGKGKGDAIRKAIDVAQGDIVVFIDADCSHNPADIPRLVNPILEGRADHVSGSRARGGSDELHGDFGRFLRMVGSDIITLGINYRFKVRLTDSQNGFRALNTEVARSLNLQENITTIEQEMTIKSLRKGYRLLEIPTHEYHRCFGESRISLSRVSFRYVYSWLKYMFWK